MALIDTGPGYTQTGNGPLTRWANGFSFFNLLRGIPLIGGLIGGAIRILGFGDTIIESAGYLLKGQFGSAATAAVAGTVSTAVNLNPALWWANDLSGALTGATLGTHARMLTEKAIGGVTGALGVKPTVLRSYTAGVGSLDGSAMPSNARAGQFTSKIANERGYADANAYYANKMSGEAGSYVSPSLTGAASVA